MSPLGAPATPHARRADQAAQSGMDSRRVRTLRSEPTCSLDQCLTRMASHVLHSYADGAPQVTWKGTSRGAEEAAMEVTLLYGHPQDTREFERYYPDKHLPLAA